MSDVVCFCGCYYRFAGDIGMCPRCGEYLSLTSVSPEEEQQMRDELDLLLAANEQSFTTEGSAETQSDFGRQR